MNHVVVAFLLLVTFCCANSIVRPDGYGGVIIGDGPVVTYDNVVLQGTTYPNELDLMKQDQASIPDQKIFNLESLAVQRLPAFSTLAATAFVNSTLFLATGTSGSSNNNSTIYAFNTTSNTFVSFQEVTTSYNKKWTSFTIGTTTYMIYANSYTIGSTISVLYSVSSSGLTIVQNITCNTGINSWEHFTYGGSDYLVGATISNSLTLFKWNQTAFNNVLDVFSVYANIYAMDSFKSTTGVSYLALSINTGGFVLIYTYTGTTFSLTRNITSSQPSSVKFFTNKGIEYLVIAEAGRTPASNYLYSWNSSLTQVQAIQVTDILGWEFFTYNSEQYLISAHSSSTSVSAASYLFKWNGYSFSKVSDITTIGAMQWISFTINSVQYLFVNCKSQIFSNAESLLFQLP